MGAISLTASLPVLEKYQNDSNRSVRETCEIAIAKIEWDHSEEGQRHFTSTTTEPQFAAISLPPARCLIDSYDLQNLHLRRSCTPYFQPSCGQVRNCDTIKRRGVAREASRYTIATV